MIRQKSGLMLWGLCLISPLSLAWTPVEILDNETDCKVESLQNMWLCGQLSGRWNTLYYSTHDAYFVHDLNQDTISSGGFIKYTTAPLQGVQAGVSFAGQRRLDDQHTNQHEIAELEPEKDGIAEAWLSWTNTDWNIRLGQQSLDVPFIGNYDWRIMPPLFHAVDLRYGQQDDYIRATYIDRFKSYADDQFLQSSRYSDQLETDGAWSLGFAKSIQWTDQTLKSQLWFQSYEDYVNVLYAEGHVQWPKLKYQPDLAVQVMQAQEQGDAKAGKVDHQGIGVALTFKVNDQFTLKTAYNYIKPNPDSYLNGALFAPYMVYTSSGPYFAQPFFTSTQDLGAGNAFMLSVEGALSESSWVGANYSFMNLAESDSVKDLNQSEYVLYGIYNLSGALKGWSVANFFGFATSPRSDDVFVQNRLGIKYTF